MSGNIVASSPSPDSCVFITRENAAQKRIQLPRDLCVYGENLTADKMDTVVKLFGVVQQHRSSKKPSSAPFQTKAWEEFHEYTWGHNIWLQMATIVTPETSYDYYGVKIPFSVSISMPPKTDEKILREALKLHASIFKEKASLQERQKAIDAYTEYMQLHSNEVRLRVFSES